MGASARKGDPERLSKLHINSKDAVGKRGVH